MRRIVGAMRFELVDAVIELSDVRIVALKHVSAAEEYLQDHFPTFPVLPGVMMVEAMTQAARRLLASRDPALSRHVLGGVRALKFGAMVRPGDSLRVEAALFKESDVGVFEFKCAATALRPGPAGQAPQERSAASGRLTLRPLAH